MYEDFLISEACSRFLAFDNQQYEAQDIVTYFKYIEHANLCKKAAKVCCDFLKNNDIQLFILRLKILGLQNNVLYLKLFLNKYKK